MKYLLAVALLVGTSSPPDQQTTTSGQRRVVAGAHGMLQGPGSPSAAVAAAQGSREEQFTTVFGEDARDLVPTGTNPFFVLETGFVLVLEGKDDGKDARTTITVTTATRKIDGVETRVVEEVEVVGGQTIEITRDYFAISRRTNNVYYFGEDVDVYTDGKVSGHAGSWRAGENGAAYGLMMPGTPLLGARYHQEVAPGVGMDRAEVVSLAAKFECPAGKFADVLQTEETTPLKKDEKEHKLYARGVGLLQDGGLRLTRYGKDVK
ncbi:MAG TPA: hypothetical protein VK348_04050 [Planctomycetota bacterium]|nr:hypothetical protein [Planctomycetota bacterium]